MNEVEDIRLKEFRQLKKEIRGSKDHLIVGIDIAKEKHHTQDRAFFALFYLLSSLLFPNFSLASSIFHLPSQPSSAKRFPLPSSIFLSLPSAMVILSPSPPVTLSETKGLVFRLRVNSAKGLILRPDYDRKYPRPGL